MISSLGVDNRTMEPGYWTKNENENIRRFFDGFAESRKFDPLDPIGWSGIRRRELSQAGVFFSSFLLYYFLSPFFLLLWTSEFSPICRKSKIQSRPQRPRIRSGMCRIALDVQENRTSSFIIFLFFFFFFLLYFSTTSPRIVCPPPPPPPL
jgi:hypothetical protein